MSDNVMLRTECLDVQYGSFRALFDVSVELPTGTMVALLGANGAGKSTLGRSLSGLLPARSGRIEFDGQDVTKWPAHRRRRAGLAYIPEGRGIFPGLSVMENLRVTVRHVGGRGERAEAIDRALSLFPVLGQRRLQRAGSLSGGEQQMLALGCALAVEPKVLIADEMSLGLAPLVVDAVFEGLERACAAGITVLLIEQFIHRALGAAHSCVILSRGRVSWAGPASGVGPDVLDRYLGEAAAV